MKKWILMASLCLVAVAAQAQSYKEYVRKALDAMSMDSTEVAERLFREAMRVEPAQRSNAMIYYQIGRMQEHRGKLEKALESYTMGLNVAPHVLPLRMARAKLYMQLGNKEKALVDYSDVLDWKADEQEALFMRAYIYTEQRLYKKARTDYEALLKLNPAHEEARIGLTTVRGRPWSRSMPWWPPLRTMPSCMLSVPVWNRRASNTKRPRRISRKRFLWNRRISIICSTVPRSISRRSGRKKPVPIWTKPWS